MSNCLLYTSRIESSLKQQLLPLAKKDYVKEVRVLGAVSYTHLFNLGAILSAVNPNGVFLPTSIEPVQVIIVIAFSLLLSLLSTIYPAYRAAKTEPAEALRYE